LRQACKQAAKFFPDSLAAIEVARPEAHSFLAGTLASGTSGAPKWAIKESPLVDLYLGRAFDKARGLKPSASSSVTAPALEGVPHFPKARKLGSFVAPPYVCPSPSGLGGVAGPA